MKYHHLSIFSDDTAETYQEITKLLGVEPLASEETINPEIDYGTWVYAVKVDNNEPYFDFINVFLDLLEPKFDALGKLGIFRSSILFWLLYNYEHQCSLSFNSQEMQRLGASGITLNIDCWQEKTK